jgi:hypothetical protein
MRQNLALLELLLAEPAIEPEGEPDCTGEEAVKQAACDAADTQDDLKELACEAVDECQSGGA